MRAAQLASGSLVAVLAAVWVCLGQERPGHPAVRQLEEAAGAEFTACIECHGEKTSAPVVHAPVAAGCDTCHAARQERGETEILLTIQGDELCLSCHGDKQPQPTQLSLHPPLRTGPCLACHDPHGSEAPSLLRQATESREAAENLCLGCHGEIDAQAEKSTQHAAMDLGCATCHTTHKSEPADRAEGRFHLSLAEPELCLACHEGTALEDTHLNQPVVGSRCSECHNPHGSEQAKLLNTFVHAPFAERACEACHEPPQQGQVTLVEGARRELCVACHSDIQERLDQSQAIHGALAGESGCVGCHSPHAATYSHQLRRGPVALCLGCHTDLAQARVEKAYLHRPVFEQSCLICHEEHSGERPLRLRAEVNELCLECHGSQNAAKFQQPGRVKLFGDTVEVGTASLVGMRILSVRAGAMRGHPMPAHPISGEGPLNCVSCHNVHAANGSPKLLATETPTSTPLCVKCHK